MNTTSQERSEFARVLSLLIDEAGLYKRREWAEILSVSMAAISQWLNDHTFPRAEILRMFVSVVRRNSNRIPAKQIEALDRLLSAKAERVAPAFSQTIGDSLGSYLVQPLLKTFLQDLNRLPSPEQEELILRFAEECADRLYRLDNSYSDRPSSGVTQELSVLSQQQTPDKDEPRWLVDRLKEARVLLESNAGAVERVLQHLVSSLGIRSDPTLRDELESFCLSAIVVVESQQKRSPASLLHGILKLTSIPDIFYNFEIAKVALVSLFLEITGARVKLRGNDISLAEAGFADIAEKIREAPDRDIVLCLPQADYRERECA